jgi:DNA repair protein RecO (recombination protein O)
MQSAKNSKAVLTNLKAKDGKGTATLEVNGVKKPKAKIPMNILQPLHLLEMVVYHKTNSQIQRVAEGRAMPIFKSIPYDVVKNTIIQFLNEVLYKSIRQQQTDENLFDFIYNAISWLDETDKPSVNFHLAFLLKLSKIYSHSIVEGGFDETRFIRLIQVNLF